MECCRWMLFLQLVVHCVCVRVSDATQRMQMSWGEGCLSVCVGWAICELRSIFLKNGGEIRKKLPTQHLVLPHFAGYFGTKTCWKFKRLLNCNLRRERWLQRDAMKLRGMWRSLRWVWTANVNKIFSFLHMKNYTIFFSTFLCFTYFSVSVSLGWTLTAHHHEGPAIPYLSIFFLFSNEKYKSVKFNFPILLK